MRFTSRQHAEEVLRKASSKFELPIKENFTSIELIVKSSVGSNIFRAMGTKSKQSPKDVYQTWAKKHFNKIYGRLKTVKSQYDYDEVIYEYTDCLLSDWLNKTSERLSFGTASKIVNLLIKHIQESPKYRIERLIKYQHVPLDSYTLRPFIHIINHVVKRKYDVRIPSTATMSYIVNKQHYEDVQECIKSIYKTIKYPPIHFDYFCWNGKYGLIEMPR